MKLAWKLALTLTFGVPSSALALCLLASDAGHDASATITRAATAADLSTSSAADGSRVMPNASSDDRALRCGAEGGAWILLALGLMFAHRKSR